MATLRKATEADISDLVDAARRSWVHAFASFVPFEAIQFWAREDTNRKFIETAWRSLVVPEVDGKACGFLQIRGPQVAELFIHPRHHRKGLGRQLLEFAEAEIAGKGYSFAVVESLEGNAGANAFYRASGWSVMERYDGAWGYRELGALVFMKELRRAGAGRAA